MTDKHKEILEQWLEIANREYTQQLKYESLRARRNFIRNIITGKIHWSQAYLNDKETGQINLDHYTSSYGYIEAFEEMEKLLANYLSKEGISVVMKHLSQKSIQKLEAHREYIKDDTEPFTQTRKGNSIGYYKGAREVYKSFAQAVDKGLSLAKCNLGW